MQYLSEDNQLINIKIWKSILSYIENYKSKNETSGILICGSFAKGKLREGSDIDILFLQDKSEFKMELYPWDYFPIDHLQTSPEILISILNENSDLSDTLSLSFGSHQLIIEDSKFVEQIIKISKQNIIDRKLSYNSPKEKAPHIVDGAVYTVSKINSHYQLLRDGTPVL